MKERSDRIQKFLQKVGWGDASQSAIAGDLSSRSYTRLLRPDGTKAVFMDAPSETDGTLPAFIEMTKWLQKTHLSAPQLIAEDIDNGFLLLEDLGQTKVSDLFQSEDGFPEDVEREIISLLILLRAQEPPALWQPNASELADMTRLADTWLPGVDLDWLDTFRKRLTAELDNILNDGSALSLRDFHADNLMWLSNRRGIARLGLLDYQDAFITHPVYDLVSFLTDARVDVSPSIRKRLLADYVDASGDDYKKFGTAFALFSAQRNLRIMGVFLRAAKGMGKTHHLEKLPRVYGYFLEALEHRVFSGLSETVITSVPLPTLSSDINTP